MESQPVPAQAATARLFIALWPGTRVAAALRSVFELQRGDAGSARPVALQQLHLTLHFLGNVPRQDLPGLAGALALPCPTLRLRFSRCERWPHGLVVAPPETIPAALADLQHALGETLRARGLRTEARAFRPHVALARRHPQALRPVPWPAPVSWTVRGYALVESLAPLGSGYQVRSRYP